MKVSNRASQTGQALIIGIGLVLICAVALFVLFSRAQLTVEKQRLTTAADAAAYSAAIWRARVMNFDAYANRAIIAQEVMVAQAVTLTSWSKYFEEIIANGSKVASFYPPLAAVMNSMSQVATMNRQITETAAELEIAARATKDVGYKFLLEHSQSLLGLSAGPIGMNAITMEVGKANHGRYWVYLIPDQGMSFDHVKRYETLAERQVVSDVVQRSLDPFTAGPRSGDQWVPLTGGFCLPTAHLRKRGGTSLSEDLERWEAVDTLSLHLPRGFIFCRERESIPIGYGAAESADQEEVQAVTTQSFDINRNRMALGMASGLIKSLGHYGGMARVMDLDYDKLGSQVFPSFQFAVVARVAGADVRSANNMNLGIGRLRAAERFEDQRLRAISAAEVYFRKPTQASDGQAEAVEYASLYSPYWQARLVAPTVTQRLIASKEPS